MSSIGAPTGVNIWSEPARPALGVAVSPLRWVRVGPDTYQISASGPAAAAAIDNGDGTFTLTDEAVTGDVGFVGIGSNFHVFGVSPT